MLLQAEGFEEEFIEKCKQSILKGTVKKLDPNKVKEFCTCELNLIKQKKLSDQELKELSNPNSILFYEISFKCGSPFETTESESKNWNNLLKNDLSGPTSDTISMLSMNGMSFVKLTIGSNIQVWMLDSGASDLLINKETEDLLKKEEILNTSNYLGITEYEMANGTIDSCRKYRVNGIKIGHYNVDNVIIAVSDKGRQLLVGKSLLNKFSSWIIDNKNRVLLLTK
ncbi:MAG: retroviral-like aspartic protease family protein [Chitinophagaceae bacterium]